MRGKPVLRNRTLFFVDIILTAAAVLGGYALRFELGAQFYDYLPSAYWMIGAAVVLKPTIYYLFGMYRRMWSYASINELKLIVAAVSTASVFTSMTVGHSGSFESIYRRSPECAGYWIGCFRSFSSAVPDLSCACFRKPQVPDQVWE